MNIRKKLGAKAGLLFPVLGFLCLAAGLLIYPDAVKKDLYEKLLYCFTLLIPTLFPFIALTSYAVNSSVGIFFGKLFAPVTRYVFRLPKACAAPILLSFLGGYPSGASAISILLEKGAITKKEAGRMLLFCVNPGVAFAVSFLGGTVLRSPKTGMLLYLSVVLSGLLVGAVSALFSPIPRDDGELPAETHKGALIGAAFDASQGLLRMVGCVMLFTAILTIVNESGLVALLCSFLSGVFPVAVDAVAALSPFAQKSPAASATQRRPGFPRYATPSAWPSAGCAYTCKPFPSSGNSPCPNCFYRHKSGARCGRRIDFHPAAAVF